MRINLQSVFGKKMPKPDTTNPYVNARRSWNSHVGSVMEYGTIGFFGGLLCLLIALAAVGGIAYIGSQSKFIPLVYQKDASGNTISMTRADRIPDAKVDDYRSAVGDFISNIRLVTPDAELQGKAIWHAYAYLAPSDPATLKANEYLNATKEANPYNRAANETVSVDIKSVLQQSQNSWQVDWLETIRARDGSPKGAPYMMRALVTIYQNPDAELKDQQMFWNPHHIFIKDFNWSKQF